MRQKTPSEEDEEDERTVVAPNMGAGGSHPQATSGPKEEEEEEQRRAQEAREEEEQRRAQEAREEEEQRRAREAREEEEQRRACEAREEEEQRRAQETEKQEWEGKAAQDGELAAMEERRRERHLEKSQGGVDEAEVGARWAEVWVSGVCFGCGEEVFLGCKCENGPSRVGLIHEEDAPGEKEDGIERQEDSDGWGDREGWQRERRIDVRWRNGWQSFETEHEENGEESTEKCGTVTGRVRRILELKEKEGVFVREEDGRTGKIGFEGLKGGSVSNGSWKK